MNLIMLSVAAIARKKANAGGGAGDGVLRSLNNFTGSTSGGLTVSSSSDLGAGFDHWKSFDGATGGGDAWLSASMPAWVKMDFGAAQQLYEFEYYDDYSSYPTARPTAILIESSDNNSTWTTRSSITPPGSQSGTWTRLDLDTPASARYWRFTISSNAGAGYSGFIEVKLYS